MEHCAGMTSAEMQEKWENDDEDREEGQRTTIDV